MPVKWHPSSLDREIDSLLNSVWGNSKTGGSSYNPRADIEEHEDRFELQADLPGVKKDEVSVTVENGALAIKGERKRSSDQETNATRRSERVYGAFSRSFRLGEQIVADEITANYRDGVLTVGVPKVEVARPRSIKVKVA